MHYILLAHQSARQIPNYVSSVQLSSVQFSCVNVYEPLKCNALYINILGMASSVIVDRHEELPFPVECTEDNNLSSQTVGQQEVLMFPVQCSEPNNPALLNVNIPRRTALVTRPIASRDEIARD